MGGMARRRRLLIGVAMIATVGVCGWFVVVRYNALAPLLCFAPPDQQAMIDAFKDDPLYSVTPEGGSLTDDKALSYECDNGHGGSPLDPMFAEVTRRYTTPVVFTLAQLDQQFTPTAKKAGWLVTGEGESGDGYLSYCKPFGDRVGDAVIQASHNRLGSQVEVTIDAQAEGSTCTKP
jgi:hypothetical protein